MLPLPCYHERKEHRQDEHAEDEGQAEVHRQQHFHAYEDEDDAEAVFQIGEILGDGSYFVFNAYCLPNLASTTLPT